MASVKRLQPVAREPEPEGEVRRIRPRRPLPGSRAVVGALLVAVAAVALFAAFTGATEGSGQTYLVATRNLAPGDTIGPADVRAESMELPTGTAQSAYQSPSQVRGLVALAPVGQGEVVQRSAVPETAARGDAAQVSFSVDADRAVDGTLHAGDRVDVLVTYGTGASATTEVVASGAELLTTPRGNEGSGLTNVARQTLTVSVDDVDQALRLVHAARAGEVTLLRTTAYRGEGYTAPRYSSSAPADPTPPPAPAPRAGG